MYFNINEIEAAELADWVTEAEHQFQVVDVREIHEINAGTIPDAVPMPLATVPLRLADYTKVKLSFDYFLLTGIYDAIDEIHVVYKVPEEEEWREWQNLPVAKSWKPMLLDLPEGAYTNGTQIGFYYDDFYPC